LESRPLYGTEGHTPHHVQQVHRPEHDAQSRQDALYRECLETAHDAHELRDEDPEARHPHRREGAQDQ
jgi:hypothetical protein